MAVRGFKDRVTEAIFLGRCPKGFPADVFPAARRKLLRLAFAAILDDLRSPPGNRLEPLRGDRDEQHSIRINDQYRICFRWSDAGPGDVEIDDYHRRVRLEAAVTDPLDIVATLPPLHPGELLREEFLAPLGLTAGQVAEACGLPRSSIEMIAAEEANITGDTALRLGRLFGTTPQFWMNAQAHFELEVARAALGPAIDAIRPLPRAA